MHTCIIHSVTIRGIPFTSGEVHAYMYYTLSNDQGHPFTSGEVHAYMYYTLSNDHCMYITVHHCVGAYFDLCLLLCGSMTASVGCVLLCLVRRGGGVGSSSIFCRLEVSAGR